MGFKQWLAKPRLSDESWRNQMAFVGKGLVFVVGALAVLLMGTDFLDRRATILSASGMPVGDTEWGGPVTLTLARDSNNQPIDGWCRINGSYSIKNIGDLSYQIKEVRLEVYRLGDGQNAIRKGSAKISAMNNTIAAMTPYADATIGVGEVFGPKNRMDVSFVLDFEIPQNILVSESFVLVANASGGLPKTESGLLAWLASLSASERDFTQFGPNDLRIASNTFEPLLEVCTPIDDRGNRVIAPIVTYWRGKPAQ